MVSLETKCVDCLVDNLTTVLENEEKNPQLRVSKELDLWSLTNALSHAVVERKNKKEGYCFLLLNFFFHLDFFFSFISPVFCEQMLTAIALYFDDGGVSLLRPTLS
jgi:hypothetical protein